jgi:hypothetical protein
LGLGNVSTSCLPAGVAWKTSISLCLKLVLRIVLITSSKHQNELNRSSSGVLKSFLWTHIHTQKGEHCRNLLRYFPSWSWASISGSIDVNAPFIVQPTALVKVTLMHAPVYDLYDHSFPHLSLHGLTFTVQRPSYISSRSEETTKPTMYSRRCELQRISWNDANIPIGPNLILLPVYQDGGYVRGQLIQRIEH